MPHLRRDSLDFRIGAGLNLNKSGVPQPYFKSCAVAAAANFCRRIGNGDLRRTNCVQGAFAPVCKCAQRSSVPARMQGESWRGRGAWFPGTPGGIHLARRWTAMSAATPSSWTLEFGRMV